jgi:hypothetical protein
METHTQWTKDTIPRVRRNIPPPETKVLCTPEIKCIPRYNHHHLPFAPSKAITAVDLVVPGAFVTDKTISIGPGSDHEPINESQSAPPSCRARSDSDSSTSSEHEFRIPVGRRGIARHTSFNQMEFKDQSSDGTYHRHILLPSIENLFGFGGGILWPAGSICDFYVVYLGYFYVPRHG